jgi:[ribosomal protein S18]-alanine N-acetyltransferase
VDTAVVTIEPMQVEDLPEVMQIELMSFPLPWPEEAYRHEVECNPLAAYFVARRVSPDGAGPTDGTDAPTVLGYGGMWLQYDEGHISTLAVHPRWRGRQIGERLLVRLIAFAIDQGMDTVTLEVRVSNLVAQQLYGKYGFIRTGHRRAYYSDSAEDALIMTTPLLSDARWRAQFERHRLALAAAETGDR